MFTQTWIITILIFIAGISIGHAEKKIKDLKIRVEELESRIEELENNTDRDTSI